ncbi:MAG: hypothetical protein NUW37_14775 [Planctomycetes bacterium]|nr:hypothetical protein [Planctomycetota bacterium]
MADKSRSKSRSKEPADEKVAKYIASLGQDDKTVVRLKKTLYNDDWDAMETDLRRRFERRPYIFKLAANISDDLERIKRFRKYEDEHDCSLSKHIE